MTFVPCLGQLRAAISPATDHDILRTPPAEVSEINWSNSSGPFFLNKTRSVIPQREHGALEDLHPVVVSIRHDEPPSGGERQAVGALEAATSTSAFTERTEKASIPTEHLKFERGSEAQRTEQDADNACCGEIGAEMMVWTSQIQTGRPDIQNLVSRLNVCETVAILSKTHARTPGHCQISSCHRQTHLDSVVAGVNDRDEALGVHSNTPRALEVAAACQVSTTFQ